MTAKGLSTSSAQERITVIEERKIKFGHSPDADDAFMFYAIARGKIDLGGFEIKHVVEDIESLNRRALNGELEATAVSVHAYAHIADEYAIMRAGSSVGEKYGPIVVARSDLAPHLNLPPAPRGEEKGGGWNKVAREQLRGKTIAIPGELTTAFLVLKLFEKNFQEVVVPFDKIIAYVKAGKADAGLLIHEGQITYEREGLKKVLDLGEWWWEETKLPLPLGVDVIRKNLGSEQMKALARVFKESIEYALAHRDEALDYALPYGRGLSREAVAQFVGMYVNDYTRDVGRRGEEGIHELLERGWKEKILPRKVIPEFV